MFLSYHQHSRSGDSENGFLANILFVDCIHNTHEKHIYIHTHTHTNTRLCFKSVACRWGALANFSRDLQPAQLVKANVKIVTAWFRVIADFDERSGGGDETRNTHSTTTCLANGRWQTHVPRIADRPKRRCSHIQNARAYALTQFTIRRLCVFVHAVCVSVLVHMCDCSCARWVVGIVSRHD